MSPVSRSDRVSKLGALVLLAAGMTSAQTAPRVLDTNANSWWVYNGDHPVGRSRFSILAELQWRRSNFISIGQQLLVREGLTYRVNPRVVIGGGHAFARTYRYGDFPAERAFNEHRVFEQISLRQRAGTVDLDHRFRLEQRWVQAFRGNTPFRRYQNRLRYQFRGSVPLGSGTWYAFAGDELFIRFGVNRGPSAFDQNRAFFGVGYRIGARNRLEVGYMNQFVRQRSGLVEESNHLLRVQWTSNVRLFGR